MKGRIIELKDGAGGPFRAYISSPTRRPAPGLVIGMDIFGLRELFFEIADLFASRGYISIVPDYFHDVQPNAGGDYRGTYRMPTMLDVTRASMAHLRASPDCNGRVAVTGFCIGGNVAFVAGARLGADATASYYGTRIHTLLDDVDAIACPTLLHIAEHDLTYPDTARDQVLADVVRNPRITPHVYAAPHGFASTHVDTAARDLAHSRTWALFDAALSPASS